MSSYNDQVSYASSQDHDYNVNEDESWSTSLPEREGQEYSRLRDDITSGKKTMEEISSSLKDVATKPWKTDKKNISMEEYCELFRRHHFVGTRRHDSNAPRDSTYEPVQDVYEVPRQSTYEQREADTSQAPARHSSHEPREHRRRRKQAPVRSGSKAMLFNARRPLNRRAERQANPAIEHPAPEEEEQQQGPNIPWEYTREEMDDYISRTFQ
ncbi:unnamed protein product [Arabidopsis arenosa]|uniref:Uncharacterized protein n=1 Tax=Arabidopsis arenosa TaxID=38785 RepID=A0A8S1ZMF2_ARAAE|nr:unnamed protein product [Arabidopsis arenosa]